MDMNWQIGEQPGFAAAFEYKELKLKLSLETRNRGDVIIVHCQGRIVYRDEAAALSRVVGEVLQQARKLVLDLSGVSSMDSAGIGELALLQTWAQGQQRKLKCAGTESAGQHITRADESGLGAGSSSFGGCGGGIVPGRAGVRRLLSGNFT